MFESINLNHQSLDKIKRKHKHDKLKKKLWENPIHIL